MRNLPLILITAQINKYFYVLERWFSIVMLVAHLITRLPKDGIFSQGLEVAQELRERNLKNIRVVNIVGCLLNFGDYRASTVPLTV